MIGVDLVYLPEFERQLKLGGETFLNKAFLTSELQNKEIKTLAGIWAAKEAVFKASSNSRNRSWNKVRISWGLSGKPKAKYDGIKYDISISHDGDYVIAVAVKGRSEI